MQPHLQCKIKGDEMPIYNGKPVATVQLKGNIAST